MKKIIITLCAALLTLSVSAQDNIKLRTYINPTIGNLLNYADSLGVHVDTIYTTVSGQREKIIRFHLIIQSNITRFTLTGNEKVDKKVDKRNQEMDSINANQNLKMSLLLDSIQQAFKVLADSSQENYMWEYHQNGKDSIVYSLALEYKKNRNKKVKNKYIGQINKRNIYFSDVTESAMFQYTSDSTQSAVSPHKFFRYGNFTYTYSPDSININQSYDGYIDSKAYWKTLKKIFQKEGIEKQELYISKDSTYHLKREELESGSNLSCNISKQKVLIYSMESIDLANKIIREIIDSTWIHLDKHPDVQYDMYANAGFYDDRSYAYILSIGNDYDQSKKYFRINLKKDRIGKNTTYYFFISEIQGIHFLPRNWEILKSWKNGKKTYNKKLVEQRFHSR